MPVANLRELRSSPGTGDRRSVSVGVEITLAVARFRTYTVTLLLFILEHRNQRMIPFPPNPKEAVGSTHLEKTAFRNNALSSKPLDSVSLGFAGSIVRDKTVFDSAVVSLEA